MGIILLLAMCACPSVATAEEEDTYSLIARLTANPTCAETFPTLPTVPSEISTMAVIETHKSPEALAALKKLDPKGSHLEWKEAVSALEKLQAVWSLQVALCHHSESVQIEALRALARLKNAQTVPFLLIYAQYMAVLEAGSESATVHAVIQQEIMKTLSAITGMEINSERLGQDPNGLKKAIKQWTRWYLDQAK